MRWLCPLLLLLSSTLAQAATPAENPTVSAHGTADGKIPAWSVTTAAPAGWSADCCTYAKAIGVDFVIYQGEWTGNPDRVMVLNVWPRKLPSLEAEGALDKVNYLKSDARATVAAFVISSKTLSCHGVRYEGTDRVDDLVVFCEPPKSSGIRLSWSMTVAANDPRRTELTAMFKKTVESSVYAKYLPLPKSPATPATSR